jgi:hypothetical protein
MKKFIVLTVLSFFVASFLPLGSNAQQNSPLMVVFEEKVAPCDYPQFISAQKEAVEMWKKYQMDVPVYTYQNDEYSFYWVFFVQNFATLDTVFTKIGQMTAKMEKDGYDGNAKFRNLSTTSFSVMRWDPELSYHFDDSFVQTMDRRYVEWSFFYLLSGHEKEVDNVVKEFVSFNKEHKTNYSFDTFRVLLGPETPAMIIMLRAESALALRTRENSFMEKHGEDFYALWDKFAIHMRKIENKQGWFIPSFSNLTGL